MIEADGKVIGECGLFGGDKIARTVEFGITLGDKDYWGRGYGTEATRLAVDYAFTMRNVRKVYLDVLANNPRAHRGIHEGRVRRGGAPPRARLERRGLRRPGPDGRPPRRTAEASR